MQRKQMTRKEAAHCATAYLGEDDESESEANNAASALQTRRSLAESDDDEVAYYAHSMRPWPKR